MIVGEKETGKCLAYKTNLCNDQFINVPYMPHVDYNYLLPKQQLTDLIKPLSCDNWQTSIAFSS